MQTPAALYKVSDTDLLLTNASGAQYRITRIRDQAPEDKPREKLIKYGPKVLSSSELLSVVLGVGTRKEELSTMTHRILREYGSQSLIAQTNVKKLMADLDIPETKACQIVACFALGRRFLSEGTGRAVTIRTAEQAYDQVKDMARLPKEHLRGLYLNNRYQLIHDEIISIGSVSANIVHPRAVFRPALEYNASAIILAHNHPSGDSRPSQADREVTDQIQSAGELIGIELLDHLIIATDGYYSLSDNK